MKRNKIVAVTIGVVFFAAVIAISGTVTRPKNTVKTEKTTIASIDTTKKEQNRQLVVYYFLTSYRCPSCYFIENTTRAAINENFSKELTSGRLVFKMFNVEEKGNEHFVDDYKLYTKSVVLSDVKADKQIQWKNLDKVWSMIGKDAEFKAYIVEEVKAMLGAT